MSEMFSNFKPGEIIALVAVAGGLLIPIFAAVFAACLTTTPTFAADKTEHKEVGAIFKKIDTNNDGKITLDELKAAYEKRAANHASKTSKTGKTAVSPDALAEKRFKKMDANGDGNVTLEEFTASHASHHHQSKTPAASNAKP